MKIKKKKTIQIDDLAVMIKQGFDQTDQRFGQMDKRFDRVEQRLGVLENGHEEIKLRLEPV